MVLVCLEIGRSESWPVGTGEQPKWFCSAIQMLQKPDSGACWKKVSDLCESVIVVSMVRIILDVLQLPQRKILHACEAKHKFNDPQAWPAF